MQLHVIPVDGEFFNKQYAFSCIIRQPPPAASTCHLNVVEKNIREKNFNVIDLVNLHGENIFSDWIVRFFVLCCDYRSRRKKHARDKFADWKIVHSNTNTKWKLLDYDTFACEWQLKYHEKKKKLNRVKSPSRPFENIFIKKALFHHFQRAFHTKRCE